MKFVVGILISFIAIGCHSPNGKPEVENNYPLILPDRFDTLQFPKDNKLTKEKVILGKKLFFDPNLSKNKNISCASCHIPEFAFSDTTQFSPGTNGELGFRNSPSLVNVAYKKLFHKDGGVRTLEMQSLSPLIDTNEMDGDFLEILSYLNTDEKYVSLFENAFDTLPSIYGLTRSIASFERTLIYGNSPYDVYMNGNKEALSEAQISGMNLFNSKRLNCTGCHSGFLFTDYSYQNIGLEPQFEDSGRARITYKSSDAGKFEVPSLRNVAITAPYMHNGSINSLDEVIEYFEKGGDSHPNKSSELKSFTLNHSEKKELIAFLTALTDERFRKD